MGLTKIEWTDFTFNPWWGCQKVSAGCKNCYAETLDNRWRGNHWGPESDRKALSEKYWAQPLKWNEAAKNAGTPAKVFCASMADVFEDHPQVTGWRERLFEIIERTPYLIWQLLTKRPENIMRMLPRRWTGDLPFDGMPANIWIGTSVENQQAADERIPHLLQVPGVTRFLSCEPLLSHVDLTEWIGPVHIDTLTRRCGYFEHSAVNGGYGCNHPGQEEKDGEHGKCFAFSCPFGLHIYPDEPLDQPIYKAFGMNGDEEDFVLEEEKCIHWVIAGGESGPNARPMHPDWARSLRDQARAAGIPFLFKQWGEWYTDKILMNTGEPTFQMWRNYEHFTQKMWARKGDACVDITGKRCHIGADFKMAKYPVAIMQRIGKGKPGRLLDGQEWNEFPTIQTTNHE